MTDVITDPPDPPSSTGTAFGRDLLFSLPCLEDVQAAAAVQALETLEAVDAAAYPAWRAAQCLDPNANATNNSTQLQHIETKLAAHQESLYTEKGVTARYTVQEEANSAHGATNNAKSTIVIQTHASVVNAHNCSTGSWTASWNVQILTEKEAVLSGRAKLHVYYHEGAGSNVQLTATREVDSQKVSTVEEKVNNLVAKFERQTMSYEEQLANVLVQQLAARDEALYHDLTTGLFTAQGASSVVEANLKALRRILPVTRQRFQWDSAAQKQVRLLNDRKTV
jgi:hypothetical protein